MGLSFLKLDINIMNDTKIKLLRKLPEGDGLLVLWIGLLCLGMKAGKPGMVEIGDGIPFTEEHLSIDLDIPLNTVRLGMVTFKKFKMIETWGNGEIYITNFEKHQELTKIERAKEVSKKSSEKYRKKIQLMIGDGHVTISDETDKDIDKEEDKDLEKEKEKKDFSLDEEIVSVIPKRRKKRKPSYKTEVQNQIKQTFIEKIKDIYPSFRIGKDGFKRLDMFYDINIKNTNLEITKNNEQDFIKNLEAAIELRENLNFLPELKNYVGANSEKSQNYYREDYIKQLQDKKKYNKNKQPSSRKNEQHHYCKPENSSGKTYADISEEARIQWDDFGIRTPGITFMADPKNFKGEIKNASEK